MIQRIQTIYLLLLAIVCAVCMTQPIGIAAEQGQACMTIYNLLVVSTSPTAIDSAPSLVTLPLFATLAMAVAISVVTIMLYRNRKLQAKMCVLLAALLLGWYALYAAYAITLPPANGGTFSPCWACALPAIGLAMALLARRGIVHDERLVRAADRIR